VQCTAAPDGREEEQIEFSWAGEAARHVGTVVHRWLQRMAHDRLRGWDSERVDALVVSFGRELQRRGVRASERTNAAEIVRTALKNTLAHDRGRWVLGEHPIAHSELRVRLSSSRGLQTYIMDRVFRDAQGQHWVVDFKTSRHEGAGLEAF